MRCKIAARCGWPLLAGWSLALLLTIGATAVALGTTPATAVPAADSAPPSASAAAELDDPLEPFQPKTPQPEHVSQRIEALALFAAGRVAEQQEKFGEALRLYQRALQYDPESLPVVRQVIEMARALNRSAEVNRYVLKAIELDPQNLEWVDDAVQYLASRGDFAGALKLYEQVIEQTFPDHKSEGYIRLRIEMGRLYFVTDQNNEAADAFAEVLAALAQPEEFGLQPSLLKVLESNRGRFYELFAEAFLAAGRPAEARQAYARLQKVAPNTGLYAYRLARVFESEGKHEEALKQLEAYFESKTAAGEGAPYALLKTLLEKLNRQKELLPWIERLAAGDPKNIDLKYFLAGELLAAEQWDQAQPLYDALMESDPRADALRGLLIIYRQTNNVERLLELLGNVAGRAVSLELLGGQVEQLVAEPELLDQLAEAARRRDEEKTPARARSRRALVVALLLLEAKRFEQAGEFFDIALEAPGQLTPQIYVAWGVGLLLENQYAAAADVLQRAIDADVLPDNPTLHHYLALALEMTGETEAALAAARRAVEIGGEAPRLLSRIGWVYYHAGRLDEAVRSYRELVDRFDDNYDTDEIRQVLREVRLILSNIAVIQNDIPQAEEWLEQVLDEFPDDPSALNDLGYLWADQAKNLERALAMIQKALAAEPDNKAYLDSLGWVLFRLGRADEALEPMLKAADEDAPDGVILDHLGDVYLATGNQDEARQAWQRAVKAFQRDEQPEKAAKVQAKLDRLRPAGGKR